MIITTSELKEKNVINVYNGQNLGSACELEIDTECGKVCAIITYPDNYSVFQFRREQIRIPWESIKKIGKDTVIIELQHDTCCSNNNINSNCKRPKDGGKKRWWNVL